MYLFDEFRHKYNQNKVEFLKDVLPINWDNRSSQGDPTN